MSPFEIVDPTEEPPLLPVPRVSRGEGALAPLDPLQAYINRVKEYPPLTREEEEGLAKLLHETGDKEAAFRLITANLMLVVKIAFEFRSQFQNTLDLIQEGNYGLMRAVKKFDPFKGNRLSTYAAYWIRAYMLKYLLDNWRMVKVGTTNVRRKLLYNLREVEQKLRDGGFDPGPKLLAETFGATERDVIEVQQSLGALDHSLDAPVEEGSSRTGMDLLPAGGPDLADTVADDDFHRRFHEAVSRFAIDLKPSDRAILYERLLADEPKTLQELGEGHGITREAVRQAEGRLMKRLKEYLLVEMGDVTDLIAD
ncbi:MAG: sigma-70 family RNA polymerase sigma factor [Nitrospinae bacterium]|nr:sigma-70 family RNA polymerase sigma factor [Nitrospinota bacterium]